MMHAEIGNLRPRRAVLPFPGNLPSYRALLDVRVLHSVCCSYVVRRGVAALLRNTFITCILCRAESVRRSTPVTGSSLAVDSPRGGRYCYCDVLHALSD